MGQFERKQAERARFSGAKKRAKSRGLLRFLASQKALARNDIQTDPLPKRRAPTLTSTRADARAYPRWVYNRQFVR